MFTDEIHKHTKPSHYEAYMIKSNTVHCKCFMYALKYVLSRTHTAEI